MRYIICAAMAAWAIAACTATPEAPEAPAVDTTAVPAEQSPSFEWHRTGEGTYIYHRVWGNCDTLGHGFGRNMAWGRVEMPLAQTIEHGTEETGEGNALVRFTCTDGSACLRKGALDDTPDRVSDHAIPFGTMALARQYIGQVAALKTACGV